MNHYTRWLELKKENPGKYARDIAGLMNISEAELTLRASAMTPGAYVAKSAKSSAHWKRLVKPNAFAATNMRCMNRLALLPIST